MLRSKGLQTIHVHLPPDASSLAYEFILLLFLPATRFLKSITLLPFDLSLDAHNCLLTPEIMGQVHLQNSLLQFVESWRRRCTLDF